MGLYYFESYTYIELITYEYNPIIINNSSKSYKKVSDFAEKLKFKNIKSKIMRFNIVNQSIHRNLYQHFS